MVCAHWYILALNKSFVVLGVVFSLKFGGLYCLYKVQQVWNITYPVLRSERWTPNGIKLEETWVSMAYITKKKAFIFEKIQRETKPIEQLMPGREEELEIQSWCEDKFWTK